MWIFGVICFVQLDRVAVVHAEGAANVCISCGLVGYPSLFSGGFPF